MPVKVPQSKPPPKTARWVSPAERAWLDRINRQLAYDEYMQGTKPARSPAPQAQRAALSKQATPLLQQRPLDRGLPPL